jgi:hypothetical protein
MHKKIVVIFIILSTTLCFGENVVFSGFEEDTEVWKTTDIKNNAVNSISFSSENFLEGTRSMKVGLKFPGEGCIEKDFFKDLSRYNDIVLNIYAPENAPEDISVRVLLQDNEWLWYQTQSFFLLSGKWNRLTLNVQPESIFWESIGHSHPWSEKSLSGIRKIGLKFFSDSEIPVCIYIDAFKGNTFAFPDYSFNTQDLKKYERFEITFQIAWKIKNPFDSSEIATDGVFTDPEENVFIVPGFYYQKYERAIKDNEEILTPVGYPSWKIRFTPSKKGVYRYYIRISKGKQILVSDEGKFTVTDSDKPGFLGVNRTDNHYFSFNNGDFFYPLGLNIRSPTDARYAKMVKKEVDADSGTYYYEDIFSDMHKNNLNFVEIWLAPWFASLQWKENRPGYRGLGYYNLRHAWKLDTILEAAEKNNIYIQLVIVNHGQLSTWCDKEWEDNPYNIKNGGFLTSPDEFFSDIRAKKSFKNQLRYVIARWSHSPNIFSWDIINEMNLIGAKHNFYKDSEKKVTDWYNEIAGYLRELDPSNHLVTAHYTILVDNPILSEIIDYTITNAYYNVSKNESIVGLLDRIIVFNGRFNKPTFVAEYGGTPMGGTEKNLKRDIITGLWYSYHLSFASAPLFWWHRFVKDNNLFHLYKSFSDYISGIDKTGDIFEAHKVKLEGDDKKHIDAVAFGNNYFTGCWIYDQDILKDMEKQIFREIKDMKLTIEDKTPGRYIVAFYDMEKGLLAEELIKTESTVLDIKLPPFKKWIALKVNYNSQISP